MMGGRVALRSLGALALMLGACDDGRAAKESSPDSERTAAKEPEAKAGEVKTPGAKAAGAKTPDAKGPDAEAGTPEAGSETKAAGSAGPGGSAGADPGDSAGANPGDSAGTDPGGSAGANPGDSAGANPGDSADSAGADPTAADSTGADPVDSAGAAPVVVAPSGPVWSLSCAKGKAFELTARFRPDDAVLALALADDTGQTRVWSEPASLLLFADLEEGVLGILSRYDDSERSRYIDLHALPKGYGLSKGVTARFRAKLSTYALDGSDTTEELTLKCEAHQETTP